MSNLNLPESLQDEVRDFLIYTQGTLEQQEEMAKFFKMISSSLRIEVSQQIFYSVAKQNEIIKNIVKTQVDEFSKSMFSFKSLAEQEIVLIQKEKEVISNSCGAYVKIVHVHE